MVVVVSRLVVLWRLLWLGYVVVLVCCLWLVCCGCGCRCGVGCWVLWLSLWLSRLRSWLVLDGAMGLTLVLHCSVANLIILTLLVVVLSKVAPYSL